MSELREIVDKVRSKNAGPFWVTLDIFCGDEARFNRVVAGLDSAQVAARFGTGAQGIKRFDIPELNVIKISLPRPVTQGSQADRDMHGAGWAALLAEIEIP